MTDTRAQLETTRDEIIERGKIDPIDAVNAILVICDVWDISPEVMMTALKHLTWDSSPEMILREDRPTQLAWSLLEVSQSNLNLAIEYMRDIIRIEVKLEEMDNSDT